MVALGYALSSEEHGPDELVSYAVEAERRGFGFGVISDHFHPWTGKQGNSPFVWSVLGGIAAATERIRLGTGVTCPIIRVHPAIVAHAAATTAALLPERFFLGLGTGENLNEHVTGDGWPPFPARLEKLEESVGIIRRLLTGEDVTHRGTHFTVENARLYTVPEEPPPIHVAGSGETAAETAGRIGDGFISTTPDEDLVRSFSEEADDSAPRYGQLTVCWEGDEADAERTALEWWPNSALPGQLGQELPTPGTFEDACELVDRDDIAERVVCGPDSRRHVEGIQEFIDAGFDHVYVHQVGPNQGEFFDAYEREVLPSFR